MYMFRRSACDSKPLDPSRNYVPVIFNHHGGQKFIPLFVGKGVIILILVFWIILHGCWKSVLSCNANLNYQKIVPDGPICLVVLFPLHQRWRWLLCCVIHIMYALIVLDNSES